MCSPARWVLNVVPQALPMVDGTALPHGQYQSWSMLQRALIGEIR